MTWEETVEEFRREVIETLAKGIEEEVILERRVIRAGSDAALALDVAENFVAYLRMWRG